jgi:hypothetical protein
MRPLERIRQATGRLLSPSATRLEIVQAIAQLHETLAIPLMTQYPAGSVVFTLLDIHEHSLRAVRRLVETLSLSGYVQDIVQADATRYRLPAGQNDYHSLLSGQDRSVYAPYYREPIWTLFPAQL